MREAVLLTKIIQEQEMSNHSAHVLHVFMSKKRLLVHMQISYKE